MNLDYRTALGWLVSACAMPALLTGCTFDYLAKPRVTRFQDATEVIAPYDVRAHDGLEVEPAPVSSEPLRRRTVTSVALSNSTAGAIAVDRRAIASDVFIPVYEPVQSARLSFTVTEPSGQERRRYPVRGSLPMHRGELLDIRKIRLFDDAGNEVAVQGKATAFWPEGSIKFLCIDFLTTLGPRQTRDYVLVYGESVTPLDSTRLLVAKVGDGVSVDTGMLSLRFSTGDHVATGLSDRARTSANDVIDGELVISERPGSGNETTHRLIISQVTIVEQGPVQVTLYLRGHYGSDMSRSVYQYQTGEYRYPFHGFVRLYSALTRIDFTHSLGYNGDENRDFVVRYGLVVPSVGNSFQFGADSTLAHSVPLSRPISLVQRRHDTWRVTGVRSLSGEKIEGWAASVNEETGQRVVVGLRDAWQQWPVSFTCDQNFLRFNIYGGEPGQFLDLRYMGEGFRLEETGILKSPNNPLLIGTPLHFSESMFIGQKFDNHYSDQTLGLAMGLVKTSDLVIDFGGQMKPSDVGASHHQPLIPWPGKERYRKTRVFGMLGNYDDRDPRQTQVRNYFSTLLDYPYAAHSANRLYGWVDWPDAPDFKRAADSRFDTTGFSSGEGWSNGERGVAAYFSHFVGSGWRRAFDLGHQQVLHTIGIDTEHRGGDMPLGINHRHHQVHWNSLGEARQGGWRGWYTHYWLTGNNEVLRSLEELHYAPFGIGRGSGSAHYPWDVSNYPELNRDSGDKPYLCGADCSPSHYMGLLRWITTGEANFAAHFELVMELWKKNVLETDAVLGTLQFDRATMQFIRPLAASASPYDPANPAPPAYHIYRWETYGGDDLVAEWAQLTGSANAIDTIIQFGDYQVSDNRTLVTRYDLKCVSQNTSCQLYQAPEGILPPYFLLLGGKSPLSRSADNVRLERWKKALEYRSFDYPYGGVGRFVEGGKPYLSPLQYTAQNYQALGIVPFGENWAKITMGHATEALYTFGILNWLNSR